jgi:hypothetical protein
MRQQYQQKPRQKGREDLLASTVYTKVPGSAGGLYRKLLINDGDASTYSGSRRIGPGPANPNGPFGGRERSQTITNQQYKAEYSNVQKGANAERAKARGFRSVTEMMQSDHRQDQVRQQQERARQQEEARRKEAEYARWREQERQRKAAEMQRAQQAGAERARQLGHSSRPQSFYDERMRRWDGTTDPAYVNP